MFSNCDKIKGGARPKLPETMDDRLRKLIKKCWSQDPKDRSDFQEIRIKLDRIFNDILGSTSLNHLPSSEYFVS